MFESIVAWTAGFEHTVLAPVVLDIQRQNTTASFELPMQMRKDKIDILLCINMIHISPFECTRCLFEFANTFGNESVQVVTYGPYIVQSCMVDSNIAFDASLRSRNPDWGIRHLEEVEAIAADCGFNLQRKEDMPSNNLCLVFGRK
jgi:hypothetical protein